MDIWLVILIALIVGALFGFAGYKYGYKKGNLDRKNEILLEYTSYIPLGNVEQFAREMMEEEGLSENFPLLFIMPDKYDYLEGIESPEQTT